MKVTVSTFFVAFLLKIVAAVDHLGHFLGEKSLISALESYGYSIAPVTEDDDIM